MKPDLLTTDFLRLSARLGKDPLQVQGPGGNTSIKDDDVMWIKASGTELANAELEDIFVPVNRKAAESEARGLSGDGSCRDTVLQKDKNLRPSIETTFHAALNHHVVVHTHSIATLTHAISPEGRLAAQTKLDGLPFKIIPYAMPGLPLTRLILETAKSDTTVFVLQNHGLICCGDSVGAVEELVAEVETRLHLDTHVSDANADEHKTPAGYSLFEKNWPAFDAHTLQLATAGSYYPDHVVFLGHALATDCDTEKPVALVIENQGVYIRDDASQSQHAMLHCLCDVLARLPRDWNAEAIGVDEEAKLLDWDAEKYRQALSAASK